MSGLFITTSAYAATRAKPQAIEITLEAHHGIRGKCSRCQQPAPGYDRLAEREWLFVPLWGIATYFRYAPRRVDCPEHGVVIEQFPGARASVR